MTIQSETIEKIRSAIDKAEEIVIMTHVGPDGDALGSLTGLGVALTRLGKRVTMACDDGMLRKFEYLAMADRVERRPDRNKRFDLLFAVDCGDEDRMGRAYQRIPPHLKPPVINIDHHISNTYFGNVNLVVADVTSTAEILAELIPALGVPLDGEIATSLLTGMVTDTLGFRVTGVTAETFKTAGELIAAGADLAEITLKSLVLQDYSTIKMWRTGLNKMQLEDGISWSVLSLKDQRQISSDPVSNHGLGNLIADINEVCFSIVFTEKDDGSVKVGFRSRPPWDVATIATRLGGGGHLYASGCTRYGKLDDIVSEVVGMAKEELQRQQTELNN